MKRIMEPEMKAFCDKAVKMLSRMDYPDFIKCLVSGSYWTNVDHFVGIKYLENNKSFVDVGILGLDEEYIDIKRLSIDDFMYILNGVTAKNIEKYPEEEKQYKELYQELVNSIKSNTQGKQGYKS